MITAIVGLLTLAAAFFGGAKVQANADAPFSRPTPTVTLSPSPRPTVTVTVTASPATSASGVSATGGTGAYSVYSQSSGSMGPGAHGLDFDDAPPDPANPFGQAQAITLTTGYPAGAKLNVSLLDGQTIIPVPSHTTENAAGCAALLAGTDATTGGDDAVDYPVGPGDALCFRTDKGRIGFLTVTGVVARDSSDLDHDHISYRATVWNDPNDQQD